MEFNAEKYHVIKFGKSAKRPDWDYKLGATVYRNLIRRKI